MEPSLSARKHRLSDVNSPNALVHKPTPLSCPPSKRPNNNLHHPRSQALSLKSPAAEPAPMPTTISAVIPAAVIPAAVIPAAEVESAPTTTTLLIDGHEILMPKDPLQAFHTTRSQTIASFRAVWAGAPGPQDTGFVFGTALAPAAAQAGVCGGLSIRQPIVSHHTGNVREISIHNHVFIIPTDEVAAFLATRGMTMESFRRVAEGGAEARDIALVSGTATVRLSEESMSRGRPADKKRATADRMGTKGERPPAHQRSQGLDKDDDRDEEEEYDQGEEGGGNEGGEDEEQEEEQEEEEEKDKEDEEGVKEEEKDEEKGYSPPACSAPTIPTTRTPQQHNATATAPKTAPTPKSTSVRTPTAPGRKGYYPKDMPLGDFSGFAQAQRELGVSHGWCKGKYIEGLLSIGGVFAETREVVGKGKCRRCTSTKDRYGVSPVCRVLVGEDPWVRMMGNKCGLCVQQAQSCNVEENLEG
ncbi:hypothetical protein P167DRAFT_546991 [Morchella conica CCBAS932]|uniref:Uncharacterized protein n=1 Tax=Morchella conica CCBAS932 TaxID=1392247 RepID=A0A3N4KJE8_9PEZI|nr:hypothetical protein P167DRAFT_546991 [Morchella conica CCBAS932]